jgi:glutathione S-transferase
LHLFSSSLGHSSRLVLNFKKLPHCTKWLEFPDIKAEAEKIGAPPTGKGDAPYTVPILVDPNHLDSGGKAIVLSDSNKIVEYLEDVYPNHPVIPQGTGALIAAWESFVEQELIMKAFRLIVPLCPQIISERSQEYFTRTREKWWGPLNQICPDRKKAMDELKGGMEKVAQALAFNLTGAGDSAAVDTVIPGRITYADFILAGSLLWSLAVFPEDSEEVHELMSWNGSKWRIFVDNLRANGLLVVK